MAGPGSSRLPWAAPAVLAFLVFLPTLGFGFVFDDNHLVVRNAFLREAWSPIRAFAHPFWHGTPFWMSAYYRPIVTASLALNGRLLGWGPAGFHLVNVALHAVNASLLFILARRLGVPDRAASLGAAFFAVHPASSWPVASVVARVDLMPALFILLAWLSAAPAPRDRGPLARELLLAGLLFLLALFCKESAVAFLAVPILGLRRMRGEAREEGRRWAHLATAIAALLAYLATRRAAGVPLTLPTDMANRLNNPLGHLPLPARLCGALELSGRYLCYLLAPLRFSDPHGYGPGFQMPSPLDSGVLMSSALLVAWISSAVILWLRRDRLALPIAFSLAAFLPASNLLLPIGSLYALNFLYVPLIGLSLALADLVGRLAGPGEDSAVSTTVVPRRPLPWRRILWLAGPLLLFLSIQAIREASIWRDGLALFSSWTRRFPNYPVGYTALGTLRLDAGAAREAVEPLRKALVLDDDNFEAHLNLGVALALTGNDRDTMEEALRHTHLALSESPSLVPGRINAAKILLLLDRPEEAEREAREGLRLAPGEPTLSRQLAEALFQEKRYVEAAAAFGDLARLSPADPTFRSPLVVSLIHTGDLRSARLEAQRARQDFPSLPWFDFCLARIEARSGHRNEAFRLLESVLEREPTGRTWIGRVDDFEGLRGEPRFEALLKRE